MKIQTTAQIEALSIDGQSVEMDQTQTIDLEFSAIDTGGGFKDPILDFSFSLEKQDASGFNEEVHTVKLILSDPEKVDNEVTFSYEGELKAKDGGFFEVNGRLKEDQLSRELIGFVIKRLR